MGLHAVSGTPAFFKFYGYNVAGGTTDALSTNTAKTIYKTFTLDRPGVVLSIDIYCAGNGSNVSGAFAALYSDSSGNPGNLLAVGNFCGEPKNNNSPTINIYPGATARWISFPIGSYQPAGTYWTRAYLGNSGANSAIQFYYDSGGTDQSSSGTDNWISDLGSAQTSTSRTYSIRIGVLELG